MKIPQVMGTRAAGSQSWRRRSQGTGPQDKSTLRVKGDIEVPGACGSNCYSLGTEELVRKHRVRGKAFPMLVREFCNSDVEIFSFVT